MKIFKGIFVLLFLLFCTTVSNAALMQTTWTATVSSSELTNDRANALFTPGEIFTVVSIFDDTNKTLTEYWDGTDQIAEFGEGDDIDNYTFTASFSIYTDQPQFTLSQNFYDLFAAVDNYYGYSGYENTIENWVFQQSSSYGTRFNYHADGITFEFRYDWYQAPTDRLMFARNYGGGYNDNYYDGLATFENITFSTSPYNPVPIPSAFSLLGLGLLGLAGVGRKKK